MKISLFLFISLGSIGAAATIVAVSPALAQGEQHMPASGYCTGETIQISGWEHDLVQRHKGLDKFHWSAINTVAHYSVVATPTKQITPAKPLSPYHNIKPRVIGNWSDPHAHLVDKTCIAAIENSNHTNVSAHLRSNNASVCGQMRSYESNSSGYQQAQYGGERSTEDRVSGRLMH